MDTVKLTPEEYNNISSTLAKGYPGPWDMVSEVRLANSIRVVFDPPIDPQKTVWSSIANYVHATCTRLDAKRMKVDHVIFQMTMEYWRITAYPPPAYDQNLAVTVEM